MESGGLTRRTSHKLKARHFIQNAGLLSAGLDA